MILDALLDRIQSIVRETFPNEQCRGVWEYTVFSANGNVYDLKPTDPTAPPVPSSAFKPGIPGLMAGLQNGSFAYVQFINGNPARPMITSVSAPGDAGFTPTSLALAAGTGGASLTSTGTTSVDGSSVHMGAALGAVVRVGDTITVGTGVAATNGATGVVAVTTGLGLPPLPSRVLA